MQARVLQTSSKEGKAAAVVASVRSLLVAALREGWQDGQVPLKRLDIILPQMEHEHRLYASRNACGTAPLKRPA